MKKNFKRFVAATLALLMTVTGIGAYFTSSDAKSDGYTIGQIEVEVVGDDNLYSAEKLTPNYEYEFTRSVRNIGINDAYVYMAVTLPYDEVYLHDLDGVHTANQAALTQLFTYGTNNIAGVSGEWKPVTAGKFGNYEISQVSNQLVNTSGEYGAIRVNDTVTYIYAFVGDGDTLARLAPDAETSALFDTMKFANVSDTVDQYNIEETAGQIKTQVYAIQCDNVLETTYMEGRNDDGSEAINAVWAVINNALVRTNDTPVEKVSIPVSAKDKNGVDLNASASVIEGEDKEILLDALEDQGLADKEDVDLLIDVKSDDFDDLAETTIDVSEVAGEGDKVIILHYDETKGEWEFIAEDTVDEDLTVGGDFSSFSPVAIIVVPKDEYMVLFVDRSGNPLKNAEVQIAGTSISGENDHMVVGFTDDEGYLHLTKADVEKFIKAQDEDDLFGEGPRAASEAGSCDVIFAIDKFVYVAAPEELGGEKEAVSSDYVIHNVALYMVDDDYNFASASAIASALKAELGDVLPDSVTYCPYGQGRLPNQSILLMDVNDPGNYDAHIMADWTSYEVIAQTETTVTIKLISNAYDFSQADIHHDGMTVYEDILGEFAIEGTDFTWTHTFEKKASTTSDKMVFTIVDTEGNPFNSSYTQLRVHERPATAENIFVQEAEYSNRYVGDVLPAGTYRIFLMNGGTVPFTFSEFVIEEGVNEYELVINPTPLYNVTLNVVDNSSDAASASEYVFIINDNNKVVVPANNMPYTLKLMGTGTHVISDGIHDIVPGTFDVNGDCEVTVTLSDKVAGVKLNILNVHEEITSVEFSSMSTIPTQAQFDGTYYDAGQLANEEYTVSVYTADGGIYFGSFTYNGQELIDVSVVQYAAKLVVTNADGQTVRIRMNGGEVGPWVDTNSEGVAMVNLYDAGSFNIAEVSIGGVVYDFTAELASDYNGSVVGNRVTVPGGVVIVNITLELNPQVNDKNITFHLVDGADGYYPHSSIGGIFVMPELQLAGPNGYENTFTGSDGWGETFIEAGNLPAGEYNYTLTTYAGYSTDPSMKFQSTGTFVVADDAVQTIEIVEKFDNPVGWSGMNANKYVVADNTEVMSVTSWGEVYAILPAGTQVYVNAVLDNGFYQVDLTSIEEYIIVEELYGTTGYVAVSALSDEAPGAIEYASGKSVTLTVMDMYILQNDDIWWDTPQTFYYLLTDNAELTSAQLSELVGYTAHIVPNEKWCEYRDLVHALDYDEDPSVYNSYFVDSVSVSEGMEIFVVTGFENDEMVDAPNTRVVQYNDKKHAIYHEDIGVYVTEDHTAFSETCPKCGWTCNHNTSTYTSVVDETHHNIRCYGCYSVLETVECDFTNGDCVCGNNKPGTAMTINVRFIDKYCSEFGGFDPMSTPYIPVESIKVEGDSISVANVEAAMNETSCDMGGYQIVGLVTEEDYNTVYFSGQYDWNFNFDGYVYNELTGLSNGSTIYVLLSNE